MGFEREKRFSTDLRADVPVLQPQALFSHEVVFFFFQKLFFMFFNILDSVGVKVR